MLNFYIFLGILLIVLTLFSIYCLLAFKENKSEYIPLVVLAIATIGAFVGTLTTI